MTTIILNKLLNFSAIKLLLLVLVFFYALLLISFSIKGTGFYQDESILIVNSKFFLEGKLPYVDYSAVYPLGLFFYLSPLVYFFSNDAEILRIFSWTLCLLFVSLAILKSKNLISAILCVVFISLWAPDALSWNFALIFFLLGVSFLILENMPKFNYVGYLLLGISVSIRPDFFVIFLIPVLNFIFKRKFPSKKKLKELIFFVFGFMPTLLNFLILIQQGLFLNWLKTQQNIRKGRFYDFSSNDNHFEILEFGILLTLIVILFFVVFSFKSNTNLSRMVLSLFPGAIILGLIQVTQRADSWHLKNLMQLLIGFCLLLVMSKVINSFVSHLVLILTIFFFGWVIVNRFLTTVAMSAFDSKLEAPDVIEYCLDKNCAYLNQWQFDTFNEVLKNINSNSNHSIFIGPSDLRLAYYGDTWIYSLVENPPCTRFTEMNPGDSNSLESSLSDDIKSCDILILNDGYNIVENDWVGQIGSNLTNLSVVENFSKVYEKNGVSVYENVRLNRE